MTEFADNVRRIVGIDEDSAGAPGLGGSGGEPPTRIAVSQGKGGTSVGTLPKSEDDDGIEKKTDTEAAKDEKTNAEGKATGDKPNSKSKAAGVVDAADVIDNKDGPDLKDIIPDVLAGVNIEAGTLTGIEAIDCATGKSINIRLDGLHVPPDATTWTDGTPKTSEWLDPDIPPDRPGFVNGIYWTANPGGQEMSIPYDMLQVGAAIEGQTGAPLISGGGGPGSCFGPNSFSNYFKFIRYDQISATQFNAMLVQADASCVPLGGPEFVSVQVTSTSCPGADPLSCPATAPTEDAWPEDNKISLSYLLGVYKTNPNDTDATPQYTGQDNSVVDFCMAGGRFGRIEAGVNGGHILYETDTGGGSAIGIARYFNSQGELTGFSDALAIDFYRPKDAT